MPYSRAKSAVVRTPKKKSDRVVVYPRQFPGPGDKKSTPDDSVTPHLGHEYRLTNKFSEETEMEEQIVPGRPKGARETFSKRWRLGRAKHTPHPAPIKGGHYETTPQMERRHYEEYDMNESSMRVWKHKTKDVSVDWNKHGSKYTVHVNGEKVSGHATQDSALEAAKRRARKMDESKTYEQFVTEAAKRGRPRKLRPGEEADTLHIQDQLSKLTHPNHVDVHFKDGTKHQIPREHANKALQHLNSLKPIDRADHAEHMGKGHSEFYHVLTKKSIPDKKPKITLAGPKLRKEENENDDGWLTHKEMHGSNAVSKEDWKKGVRLNKDGKRVQTRKEEVEQLDELSPDTLYNYSRKADISRKATNHRAQADKLEGDKVGYKTKMTKSNRRKEGMEKASVRMSAQSGYKPSKKNPYGAKMPASYLKKEEVEQIDEWGESKVAKGIVGTRASTRQMAATPRTVPQQGRSKKPKKQRLDVTPLQTEEKTGFAKLKASLTSMASKTKKVGGEELTKMSDPMKGKYTQEEMK
jgi:hypothetical protein